MPLCCNYNNLSPEIMGGGKIIFFCDKCDTPYTETEASKMKEEYMEDF